MNYKRFNRHDLFKVELLRFHGQTIRLIEDFLRDKGESKYNSLCNMLNGIYDGYLYDNLLETANEYALPHEDYCRIESTVKLIEEYIKYNTNENA